MKTFFHIAAPLATLMGMFLSTWGTYRLVRYYHPLSGAEFLKSLRTVFLYAIRFRTKALQEYLGYEAQAASQKQEERYNSLVAIYFLFFGFALELFGSLCWCLDSIWDIVATP
jgi:hypothetical protein